MSTNTVKGYKGFNPDMTCRDFQFKEGETYTHNGKAISCQSGFHFCTNPLDVFGYYSPVDSVFHEVEGMGQIDTHADDSKVASTEIKIGARLGLSDFIGAAVDFMFKREYDNSVSRHATGDRSAAICTGLSSKARAGKYGCIALAWWNSSEQRGEMKCAETGCGDGSDGKLKAETWYCMDESGKFVEAAP